MTEKGNDRQRLTGPWREIQVGIWLIGLAILFWQGWLWPGILILIAVSGIFEAIMRLLIKPAGTAPQPALPAGEIPEISQQTIIPITLPARCSVCGAPASEDTAIWSADKRHATCPYCKSNLVA